MILLWMMWRKGYVVQSIRQSGAVELDEGKLLMADDRYGVKPLHPRRDRPQEPQRILVA